MSGSEASLTALHWLCVCKLKSCSDILTVINRKLIMIIVVVVVLVVVVVAAVAVVSYIKDCQAAMREVPMLHSVLQFRRLPHI
jgi:hypothetical protein